MMESTGTPWALYKEHYRNPGPGLTLISVLHGMDSPVIMLHDDTASPLSSWVSCFVLLESGKISEEQHCHVHEATLQMTRCIIIQEVAHRGWVNNNLLTTCLTTQQQSHQQILGSRLRSETFPHQALASDIIINQSICIYAQSSLTPTPNILLCWTRYPKPVMINIPTLLWLICMFVQSQWLTEFIWCH